MKKFLAIVFTLIFVFSFGVSAFAADDVTGTLADGSTVSKPVSEVVKTVEDGIAELKELDAERADALSAFFADAEADETVTVIAKGIVDFAGAFADVTEAEIEVSLSVPGVKAGDKVGVQLSNGTSTTVECTEDDVVSASFPKDADHIGYVVSSKVENTWPWELPAEEETASDKWTWNIYTDEDGNTHYEGKGPNGETETAIEDKDGNLISLEYNDPNTGEKYSYTAEYDENGNLVESHNSGTTTTDTGLPVTYENSFKQEEDGTTVETQTSTVTTENGDETYSETKTTQPDGTSKVETTTPDGKTETHYYDSEGNEIFPSPEW